VGFGTNKLSTKQQKSSKKVTKEQNWRPNKLNARGNRIKEEKGRFKIKNKLILFLNS
jgi:hypothetical protein